jgi:hypothetical protein
LEHDHAFEYGVKAIRIARERGISRSNAAWKQNQYEKHMVQALNHFPNLEIARVVLSDYPNYLGGWTSPEQTSFFHYQYETCPAGSRLRYNSSAFYNSHREFVSTCVLRALRNANVKIKDLRFSSEVPYPGSNDLLLRYCLHHYVYCTSA